MLDIVALALVGCLLGVATGLTPGLHVNTVALLGLSAFPALGISPLQFSAAMVAMAVTHTFLDFIPAIFLGVPEEETALSVLPTHQLLLQGKASEAVKLTAFGSVLGLGFALLLLPPTLILIPAAYDALRGCIVYVLLAAVAALILREKKKERILWAAAVFLLTGALGVLSFELRILSTTQVLFPVFVGLFGLSNLLYSLRSRSVNVPQKRTCKLRVGKNEVFSGFIGAVGGLLVGVLPAMSPSQVGILLYSLVGSNVRSFLVSVSAINTSDAIFSFISLYTINNPRSGVATMVGKVLELDYASLLLLVGVTAFSALFACAAHLWVGKHAVRLAGRVSYRRLSEGALLLVFLLVYLVTGWFGVMLTLLSTCLGLLPILSGVSRTHCMGVLLVPTMLFFLGLSL